MRWIAFMLMAFVCATANGQEEVRLAQDYFQNGEYQKAAYYYQKLYQAQPANTFLFERYINCLIELEDYVTGEQAISKEIKAKPNQVNLYVLLGSLYEKQLKEEEAERQYQLALERMPKEPFAIIRLANSFSAQNKVDLAIAAYEKGIAITKEEQQFSYYLGDLYLRKADFPKMIHHFLNSLGDKPERISSIKSVFKRYLPSEEYTELKTQLYSRAQENVNDLVYPELLSWVFIQEKDYKNALRQLKAVDKRFNENGIRIFQLAQIADHSEDYDAAVEAYEYIVQEKGKVSSFYIDSKRSALLCKRKKLVGGFQYNVDDLTKLESEYESFLAEFGRSKLSASIIMEMADLEAFYINNITKAIALLNEVIAFPNLDPQLSANAKLSLADFYLMSGERWEATLLYSQVDKAFKEDPLGHEARFRNAKLSYYNGDFQWAQAQFEILKASTSKLIANDALDLSIFIMDNLGIDSITQALQMYADAELLVFQNRFEDAFAKMDSMIQLFPYHKLDDDVLYLRAKIYLKKREHETAASLLQQIVDGHTDGIRADNSLFELAELYEVRLQNIEKAKELYEKLFVEFSGSTFAVEARKRFRKLRGDKVS